MSLNELLDAAGIKRTVAQDAINTLLEAGELIRLGQGVRGAPYRYCRAPDPGGTGDAD